MKELNNFIQIYFSSVQQRRPYNVLSQNSWLITTIYFNLTLAAAEKSHQNTHQAQSEDTSKQNTKRIVTAKIKSSFHCKAEEQF